MKNSRFYKTLRILVIVSYCLIMLKGEMIMLPFIFYIYASIFNFEELSQITSLFTISSLALIIYLYRNKNYNWFVEIIIFVILLIPIFERLFSIELHYFYYYGFMIPLSIFITSYLFLIALKVKDKLKTETNKNNLKSLFGSWEDKRQSEDIISEINESRSFTEDKDQKLDR